MPVDRHLAGGLLAALADTPVVFLQGARQTGKSTLVGMLLDDGRHAARYLTLDDAAVLAAAQHDPPGFIHGLDGPVVIDEVQRVPDLFVAIKQAVDDDRSPGRFLLTGSAHALVLPRLAESLVGRVEILTLWPFSQGELEGRRETFIDGVFSETLPSWKPSPLSWRELIDRICAGGYPEALERLDAERRRAWFGSYVTTILQRDVRDMAGIERLSELPQLLRLLATRCGTLLNFAELARTISMPQTTLKRYMALLDATLLLQPLPAWTSNLGKRLVKSPRVMLCDTGLIASLLGLDAARLIDDANLAGRVLENFVAMEIRKQSTWSERRVALFHYRSAAQQEVDLILEEPSGRLVGIEIKASASVSGDDFRGLRHLSELLGDRLVRGIVLYRGAESVAFGPRMHALPISAMWAGI